MGDRQHERVRARRADEHVLDAVAPEGGRAFHLRHTRRGILDLAIGQVDLVGQLEVVGRGDGLVLEAQRLQLALHGRVGRGAHEEGLHVVVARYAHGVQPLDLVERDRGDARPVDEEDRRVVGEVHQFHRADPGDRIVGGNEGEPPGPIGRGILLVRSGQGLGGGIDMPRDGDGLLIGIVAVQAGAVLRVGDGGAGLARRERLAEVERRRCGGPRRGDVRRRCGGPRRGGLRGSGPGQRRATGQKPEQPGGGRGVEGRAAKTACPCHAVDPPNRSALYIVRSSHLDGRFASRDAGVRDPWGAASRKGRG